MPSNTYSQDSFRIASGLLEPHSVPSNIASAMRDGGLSDTPFRAADWHIDPPTLRLRRGDTIVRVGERAMAVLCCLVAHDGDVVSKRGLLDAVWRGRAVSDEVLTVAVYELRKALGDRARDPRYIETIHGRGYRWLAPVHVVARETLGCASVVAGHPEVVATSVAVPVPAAREGTASEGAASNAAAPEVADPQTVATGTAATGTAAIGMPIPLPESTPSAWATPTTQRGSASLMTRPAWRSPRVLGPPLGLCLAGLCLAVAIAALSTRNRPAASFGTVAVLPLADFAATTGEGGSSFADGMTGSLINALARRGIRVSAHSAVMSFRAQRPTLPEVAAMLGVDAILEGCVKREAGRVVVEVQLVDPRSGQVIWAGREETPAASALWLGRDLARSLQRFTNVVPTEEPDGPRVATRPIAPDVLDQYLTGQAALRTGAISEAASTFEAVRTRAPEFAENLAGLAEARLLIAESTYGATDAWQSARQAIELDPDLAEAHAVLGVVSLIRDWDIEEAEARLRRALLINPSLALGYQFDACIWSLRGDHRRAMAQAERAVRLDPLNAVRYLSQAWLTIFAGEPAEALAIVEAGTSIVGEGEPLAGGELIRAVALELLGRDQEAWALRRAWLEQHGVAEPVLASVDTAFAEQGLAAFYRAAVEHVADQLTPVDRAYFTIRSGDHDRALDLLEASIEMRDPEALWIGLAHHTAALRDDPRFQELLERLPSAF